MSVTLMCHIWIPRWIIIAAAVAHNPLGLPHRHYCGIDKCTAQSLYLCATACEI